MNNFAQKSLHNHQNVNLKPAENINWPQNISQTNMSNHFVEKAASMHIFYQFQRRFFVQKPALILQALKIGFLRTISGSFPLFPQSYWQNYYFSPEADS